MTAGLVCVCGQPIKPCPDTLGPLFRSFCAGWVHKATEHQPLRHTCRDGSLARPAEATVPP